MANASNGGPNDNRNGYHYDYDARGQLLRRQITPPGGTATEITGAYNANGQLCRYQSGTPASCGTAGAGSTSLSYDDAGRLKGYTYSNGATETLSYDQRGLLSSVQNFNPTCPATCNRTESRMYSGDRQLIRVSQDNPAVGYDFTWDSTRPEAEIVESRVNGTLWTRSNLGGERISLRASSSPGPSWMAYDAYGSVLPTSQIPAPATYDPFGGESDANGGPVHFGYRGELTINGMVHLRARDYNPSTSRFTTRDPLDGVAGKAAEANPYHYVNGDPLNREDPLGMRPKDDASARPSPVSSPGPSPCASASIPTRPTNPVDPNDPGSGEWGSEPWYSRGDDYAYREVAYAGAAAFDHLKGWDNAARNLRHYLGNSGEDLAIDPDQIGSEVSPFKEFMEIQARAAATDAANGAIASGIFDCAVAFTSSWAGFYLEKEWNEDWYYANYGVNIAITGVVTVRRGSPPQIEVSYVRHLFDNYNWDGGKSVDIEVPGRDPVTITDERLQALHRAGVAREYKVVGSSQVHSFRCAMDTSCPSTVQSGGAGGRS